MNLWPWERMCKRKMESVRDLVNLEVCMYVCFARVFRRVPFCFLLDEESEGVDRAGRLFTDSAVDSDIHPIKLWAKSSNVC